jgi:PIN domain nuclease of toxin-antitoxin system
LDTHAVVRWLFEVDRLSREQVRVIEAASRRGDRVALSAITLVELAVLTSDDKPRLRASLSDIFEELAANPFFQVLPLTYEIASEVASLASLRDPVDRTIVATARVHRLRLVTSDQRIIESRLVPVVE